MAGPVLEPVAESRSDRLVLFGSAALMIVAAIGAAALLARRRPA